jgi:hypothetical protein
VLKKSFQVQDTVVCSMLAAPHVVVPPTFSTGPTEISDTPNPVRAASTGGIRRPDHGQGPSGPTVGPDLSVVIQHWPTLSISYSSGRFRGISRLDSLHGASTLTGVDAREDSDQLAVVREDMNHQLIRLRAFARRFLAAVLLLAIPLCWGCRETGPERPEPQPSVSSGEIPLRVLYVGLPDTRRQEDFVVFLLKYFEQVDTADYNAFTEEETKHCDVVIFDKDGLEWAPLDIEVSGGYSRATVSLGVPGAFWVRSVSPRMGYM